MANAYAGGNFDLDTSCNVADLTTLKGSAPAAGDKAYVFKGAVLTFEQNVALDLVNLGEKSSGAATAGERVGHLTVNAGVTVTWTGDATITNSGVKCYPASAGTETKGCTLTLNGTAASPVVMTNSVGGPDASYKWKINMYYGVIGAWGVITLKYASNDNPNPWVALASSTSYTTSTAHDLLGTTTFVLGAVGSIYVFLYRYVAGTYSVPVNLGHIIVDASGITADPNITAFGSAGVAFSCYGLRAINTPAARRTILAMGQLAPGIGTASQTSSYRHSATQTAATEVVPTDFTLTDMQDGSVKFTVSNISSIAAGDYVVVYLTDGTPIFACTRTEYEADISGDNGKPANCGLIRRLKTGTAYTGLYAKYTSDLFVYGAASGTANVTPTLVPAAADVRETVTFGLNAAYRAGTLPQAKILVSGSGSYVEPVQADVLEPADGGTAYGPSGGTNGTLDLSAAEAAAAAAQLATDIAEVNGNKSKIRQPEVVLTGADAGTFQPVVGQFTY